MPTRLYAIIVLTSLAGCGTTYTPRPGQTTASLRFVTYTEASSSFYVFEAAACPAYKQVVSQQLPWLSPPAKVSIGMPGQIDPEAHDFHETLIPAEQQLLVSFGSGGAAVQYVPGFSCYIGTSFTPRTNAQYEIQYKLDNVSKACTARVLELVAVGSEGKVERVREATHRLIPIRRNGPGMCASR